MDADASTAEREITTNRAAFRLWLAVAGRADNRDARREFAGLRPGAGYAESALGRRVAVLHGGLAWPGRLLRSGPPEARAVHRLLRAGLPGDALLDLAVGHLLHADVRPDDRVRCLAPPGHPLWRWHVGALLAGAALVLDGETTPTVLVAPAGLVPELRGARPRVLVCDGPAAPPWTAAALVVLDPGMLPP